MFKEEVLDRFLRYAVIDTMSDASRADKIHPSTPGQWDLLRLLEKELKELGLEDVNLDEHGYLLARVPANKEGLPCIAFSSHVDTASDVMGNGVKPRVVRNYEGGDIKLNSKYTIFASENPELESYIGSDIVVSDGNTLLGSDDKSGISEIMTAVSYIVKHPEIVHGEIEVLFSPDEETGFGMDFFDTSRLHCRSLYTMDGGTRYVIESECFNAASVKVHFEGVSYHLGAARGRMVNALTMCSAYVNALPQAESPEATDGRYGYYCAHEVKGTASSLDLEILLRDFDFDRLQERIKALKSLAKTMELLYKGGKISVKSSISYRNMAQASANDPKALEAVFEAGKALGQPLVTELIRGGTDGARIAESGIACPNIYAGGHNMHSRFEWVGVDAMNDASLLIVEIVRQWAK
ncbi:MAG: peptidase T [Sphaerochaetaceae bacterium]|nr:peptidase T [Sphaerochaetaceae bacterium]